MSLFTVKLNNTQQGQLDKNAYASGVNNQSVDNTGGTQFAISKQRTVWITGPNNVKRQLKDGDTFTDCNYYKRFCYPDCIGRTDQEKLQNAILECTTDDGTIWVDGTGNTRGYSMAVPVVETLECEAASTYEDNVVEISTAGGYASFVQMTNTHESEDVTVRLNGVTEAVFTLEAGATQHFSQDDLAITLVEVAHDASGAAATVNVEVMYGLLSGCNS